MEKQNKILFIHPGFSTFIRADYEILIKKYPVLLFHYRPSKKLIQNLSGQIKLLWWLIINIKGTKCVYIWFADYHALLPVLIAKILKKKSMILVGGFDAVSIPQLQFGVCYKRIRAFYAKVSYRNTNIILPVDESLITSTNYYIKEEGMKVGIKHFISDLKTDILTLPFGYDSGRWYKKSDIEKKNLILTVGKVNSVQLYKRKGFDLFLKVAQEMQNYTFVIIGMDKNMLNLINDLPNNIILHDFIPNKELIDYYSKSKVFCQFSLSEGLPNTLCEAMLCECIPVGSNVNGIPHAIGDCGFILDKPDVRQATKLIELAMEDQGNLGTRARKRIVELFPLDNRESILYQTIEDAR